MELLIKSYPILALSASSVEIIIQLSHKFPFIRHSYKKFHFALFFLTCNVYLTLVLGESSISG